jgi:hypothetical protein
LLSEQARKLAIELTDVKLIYEQQISSLQGEIDHQRRQLDERPSRPEDLQLIKKLLQDLQDHRG